jgi:hypothetical protein
LQSDFRRDLPPTRRGRNDARRKRGRRRTNDRHVDTETLHASRLPAACDRVPRMKDNWSWKCARCERAVACVFCDCCAEHCASMRPNALVAHRRGKVVASAEAEVPPKQRHFTTGPSL